MLYVLLSFYYLNLNNGWVFYDGFFCFRDLWNGGSLNVEYTYEMYVHATLSVFVLWFCTVYLYPQSLCRNHWNNDAIASYLVKLPGRLLWVNTKSLPNDTKPLPESMWTFGH